MFDLLDYITPSAIFQIGDQKKNWFGEIYNYIP